MAAEELWRHPDPTATPMWQFIQRVNEKHGLGLKDYQGLYEWSISSVGQFWEACWDFVGIEASTPRGEVSCHIQNFSSFMCAGIR